MRTRFTRRKPLAVRVLHAAAAMAGTARRTLRGRA
jgi:hypothetical protein